MLRGKLGDIDTDTPPFSPTRPPDYDLHLIPVKRSPRVPSHPSTGSTVRKQSIAKSARAATQVPIITCSATLSAYTLY